MKALYINGIDTGFVVKNAEDAVYGIETQHLFENREIECVNDAFEDRVYFQVFSN